MRESIAALPDAAVFSIAPALSHSFCVSQRALRGNLSFQQGTCMKTDILIAYFVKAGDAREAIRALKRSGYRRVAWVQKSVKGEVQTGDPFRWRQMGWACAAFLLCGILTALLSSGWAFVGGIFGAMFTVGWFRRSRFGIERHLLVDHARWLVAGETVLILQAALGGLRVPMTVLLEGSEVAPVIFVLHPRRKGPVLEEWNTGVPLTLAQIQEHAERLAAEHQLDIKPLRDKALLKRLEHCRRWMQRVCRDVSEASRLEQSLAPTAEWLLDNEYILESNARDVLLNLPWKFYRQLPALANETDRGTPRIYALAREFAADTDLRVDGDNTLSFIASYQRAATLSIGELWAVPQMLRTVLIEGIQQVASRTLTELHERENAEFWANRLVTSNRRDPNQLFSLMAELTETHPNPSPYFASQIFDFLYDEAAALAPVQNWLERIFHKSMNDIIVREKNRQTKDQISIGNAFTSLRELALLDWKECFERLSEVEQILRQDPAGIYPQMDFPTRNHYRCAIEELRRGSGLQEEQIARVALELAMRPLANGDKDDHLSGHVGTYLVGAKREELALRIGCRETVHFRVLHWAYRYHTVVYFVGLGLFSAALVFLALHWGARGQTLGIQILLAALLLIPASQLALEVVNYLVIGLCPPRSLPKMDFRISGIPDACRTLVVVPMMLTDERTVRNEAEKLEIRYLANKEANLLFALYSDYKDAATQETDADAPLLHTATECIETLNQRYGEERFLLLHRERKWCETEQKFIGWERKRGKLEELNDLIVGTRPQDAARLVYVGTPEFLANIRFVITLDSDTQLPHDTARRMIETLAHPLNQARFDEAGRVLPGGYTIIQPRVSPSLPSASGSPFSRLFSNPVGIDPYTNTVSDAYQDLTGEGSYQGKGIYDVRAFSRVLSGRFPEACLLSHDLIEGAHVRVGLASDIELYDEFPQDYLSYAKRQHRWIRGDWQIVDWILLRVPAANGKRVPNPLSWFDRWKVFDNLRRSILPATNLSLLLVCWFISTRAGWAAAIVVATQLFFHSLSQPLTWITTGQSLKGISLGTIVHDLLRALIKAALLPYQSWLELDAIARVFYRRCISHRNLLEWTSAQAMHGKASSKTPLFLLSVSLASLFSILIGFAVVRWMPDNFSAALPWLALWFFSALIAGLLCRRPVVVQAQYSLPAPERIFLRKIARLTWRYFADFVNAETSWLPPDNYQVSYQNKLALRTSPTNIGLYMTSVLGAHAFGYLTVDAVAEKLTRTFETLGKLERHEGHLLNWYDIETLEPLQPRYVSSVDSGNLLGALWTLEQGLQSLLRTPLLNGKTFAGLCDAGEILHDLALKAKHPWQKMHVLEEMRKAWEFPPQQVPDGLLLLRQMDARAQELSENIAVVEQPDAAYWAGQIQSQLAACINTGERYLALASDSRGENRGGNCRIGCGCCVHFSAGIAARSFVERFGRWDRPLHHRTPQHSGACVARNARLGGSCAHIF